MIYQTLSFLSLYGLIASPLVSINYKSGAFNTKKFLWVSGVSLVTGTINFSLYKSAGIKRFNFSSGDYYLK